MGRVSWRLGEGECVREGEYLTNLLSHSTLPLLFPLSLLPLSKITKTTELYSYNIKHVNMLSPQKLSSLVFCANNNFLSKLNCHSFNVRGTVYIHKLARNLTIFISCTTLSSTIYIFSRILNARCLLIS